MSNARSGTIGFALLLLLSLHGLLAASMRAASSTSVANQVVRLVVASDGFCVDVPAASKAQALQLQQYACNGTAAQTYTLSQNSDQSYTFTNLTSRLCLESRGTSSDSGDAVDQNTCSGVPNQSWKARSTGSGRYKLTQATSGLCLDVTGASVISGAKLEQWSCNGGTNQSFKITNISTGMDAMAFSAVPKTAVVLPAPSTVPATSWIGNSLSGSAQAMQIMVDALFVAPDGTAYANAYWDEGGHEAGIYKDGLPIGAAQDTHGWGRSGGYAITSDGTYVYLSMKQGGCDSANTLNNSEGFPQYPSCGTSWGMVRRYDLKGQPAPFPGGYGHDGSMLLVNTTTDATATGTRSGISRGLAIGNGELYVSDPLNNQIDVYSIKTLARVRSWTVTSPGAVAYSPAGSVWVAQAGGVVQHYSPAGIVESVSVKVSLARALAFDTKGSLYVADNGLDQNVKIYGNVETSPTLLAAFGTKGGVDSGPTPGALGPSRFYGINGVGVDACGNIYISQNGRGLEPEDGPQVSTAIRALTSSGTQLWNLYANEYVNGAIFDPASDGLSVYDTYTHYTMDYTQTAANMGTPDQITINRLAYPDDPRSHSGDFTTPLAVRWIGGHKILFQTTVSQVGIQIYRFNGDVAVPSGMMTAGTGPGGPGMFESKNPRTPWPTNQPSTNNGAWIWRDANGNASVDANEYSAGDVEGSYTYAWSVDLNGNVWEGTQKGVRKYTLQGLDSVGNPVYTYAQSTLYPVAGGFANIMKVNYVAATDTMYVSGYLNGASDGGCWGGVGSTLTRIDNFTQSTPTTKWMIALPWDCTSKAVPASMDVAGNAVFTVDLAHQENGASLGTGILRVYDAVTGLQTVSFYPGSIVGGGSKIGWTDTGYALHAFERANGQYVVSTEDDLFGKILIYTW